MDHELDAAWNAAGAHAQALRERVAVLEALINAALSEFETTTVMAAGETWQTVSLRFGAAPRMLEALTAALEQKP